MQHLQTQYARITIRFCDPTFKRGTCNIVMFSIMHNASTTSAQMKEQLYSVAASPKAPVNVVYARTYIT